ncbi:hypothetical protein CLNEO_15130 [Anaerotignum neopropionicum]|uniref:Gram-positive cocci surface proteins LPxTG domain-containing protein n=1 Tax=Anaerotignum neopropionicum TaxID=36847 RepID=A0A136WER2_9FIRM|nr:peptidase [Anaerotignum neopropionicum]KXL52971.1 hypothetical protein CLNEO_15130 [Anaerotignum neopropionicum]
MKQMLALILTALLLCGMLAPSVFAEVPPADTETNDTVMDSHSDADTDDNIDTITPSDTGTPTDTEEPPDTDENDTPDETQDSSLPQDFDYTDSIISYTIPDAFTDTFEMDCEDTSFTQLHNALDSVGISGTAKKDDTSSSLALSVIWDFSTVDAETPGSYSAVGCISIPHGAILADGLESTLSISVQVVAPMLAMSPGAITLTSFDEPYRTDAVAFAVNTPQEVLDSWFADCVAGFSGYDADGNYYDLVSGAWSLDAVDTSTVGVYYVSTTPNLGTEYTLAEGVSLPRQLCAVSIQTPGEPDINCCVAGRGFLHFPWVISAVQQEQLDDFTVWLRQDDGEWSSLSDGFLLVSDGLQLSQWIFISGSTYELKVTYPGGQTGVLSFQFDGELSIIDYSGGDRDGGDTNGSDTGSNTQPAPTTPHTPNNPQNKGSHNSVKETLVPPPVPEEATTQIPVPPTQSTPEYSQAAFSHETEGTVEGTETCMAFQQPGTALTVMNPVPNKIDTQQETVFQSQEPASPVFESYSPTQTEISAMRLQDLCADGESVVFGSGNLTVSIPSSLLLALNLSDSDTLTVTLTQPKSNEILLAVAASGKSVMELAGTVLRLRYMPLWENSEITVGNEAGEKITDISYDDELLCFAADMPGTYTISELANAEKTHKSVSPLLPASMGLMLAGGGIAYFRRKHHG